MAFCAFPESGAWVLWAALPTPPCVPSVIGVSMSFRMRCSAAGMRFERKLLGRADRGGRPGVYYVCVYRKDVVSQLYVKFLLEGRL